MVPVRWADFGGLHPKRRLARIIAVIFAQTLAGMMPLKPQMGRQGKVEGGQAENFDRRWMQILSLRLRQVAKRAKGRVVTLWGWLVEGAGRPSFRASFLLR